MLPKLAVDLTSKIDVPGKLKHNGLVKMMAEKWGKAVTQFEITKITKVSSKKKKKNPSPSAEANAIVTKAIPPVLLPAPTSVSVDVALTVPVMEVSHEANVSEILGTTSV